MGDIWVNAKKEAWYHQGISIQNGRPSNMDRILCKEYPSSSGPLLLAAVSDGVGSAKDGAYAAEYAVRSLAAWLEGVGEMRLGLSLRDRVLQINRELIEIAQREGLCTAATLSVLLVLPERYILVHVGDSRVYQIDRTGISQLTRDNVSHTGYLTACLGHWEQIAVQYEEGRTDTEGFLLCTDGLYKHLTPEMLEKRLSLERERKKRGFLEALVRYATDQGETDNISAILIQRKK